MPFAQLPDVRLHYRIDGDAGSPPLLLSNSLGTSLEMWEPQIGVLEARFRVIRYDSRGHGRSEVTRGPYSIEMLAQDALALLDALAIPRAHVCGLSMGGVVAMWLGVNTPGQVDRLVLANTAAKIGTAELWNARIEAVQTGGMASIAPAVLARFFSPQMLEQPTPMIATLFRARRTKRCTNQLPSMRRPQSRSLRMHRKPSRSASPTARRSLVLT